MVYTSSGSTWNWIQYFPNDPETRYLKLSGGTLTGPITLSGAPTSGLHAATKTYVDGYVNAINGDIASLSSSKLDSSTASSTYAPLASPTFTGTVTIPAGASISGYLTSATAASIYQTQAGMSSYLTTANASSTYQPLSGMSSYLTTSTAGSTYAPLASPTFTGTVTIPAGASISGYLTSANAASTYLTQSTAASTYQTQAGMSSYLTTSSAATTYQTQSGMSSYLTSVSASATYLAQYTVSTTAINKTLSNRERCTVTASGLTITLPASPTAGFEVTITIGGTITNTVIARNGSNIMSLAEDMTIDKANVSVTLYYVDATRGWRVI
jgi:hypothetical protein